MLSTLSRHWLVRAIKTESSLSRDFTVLSGILIFTVCLLSAWLTWRVYIANEETTVARLETEVRRIDAAMATNIDNSKYVMEALARQIFLFGKSDHQQIAKILRTFDTRPDVFGLLAWIDEDQKLVISSNRGVITDSAVDVSDREYQQSAREYPWKVHIGEPIAGRVSGKWVLPVVMGLTDDTGRYVGTIIISLDIDGLINKLDKNLGMEGVHYALVSNALTVLGEGSKNNGMSIEEELSKQRSSNTPHSLVDDGTLHPAGFINRHGYASYYAHSQYYPYHVVVTYDRSHTWGELVATLTPRLLQLVVTAAFLLGILWLIRHRIIKPVMTLSHAASILARGKEDVEIPTVGPVEIANLGHQLQRVKEYIDERRRIEDELRRKNNTLREAKEQSELADQSKSEFLATMSHELRTPLNAIIGFSDVMMNGYYGKIENEKYEQYVEDIYHSGQHLLEIINDILDLAKVESGVMQLHESEMDIGRTIQKGLRLLSDRAQFSNLTVEMDIPPNLPVLYADPLRMKQILINLLSNAIKFTPEGGKIRIWAEYDSRKAQPLAIHVSDTGVGMAPEHIPIALSKFGQVEADPANRTRGTGLGLPLSVELMKLHQGTLELTSELGQGTTATLTFPAARMVKEQMSA